MRLEDFAHPTAIAILFAAASMIFGSIVQYIFLRGLRIRYPNQWFHAGQPTIWTDQSLMSAWPTIAYLMRRDFATSGDSEGIAHCQRYRSIMVSMYWLTVFSVVAAIAAALLLGWPPQWQ